MIYLPTEYNCDGNTSPYDGGPCTSGFATLSNLETEIQQAVSWWGDGVGFFFDEMGWGDQEGSGGATSDDLTFYDDLYSYAQTTTGGDQIEFNPGATGMGSTWATDVEDNSDLVNAGYNVFDNTRANYPPTFPSWVSELNTGVTINTGASGTDSTISSEINTDIEDALDAGCEFFYETQGSLPNFPTASTLWKDQNDDI